MGDNELQLHCPACGERERCRVEEIPQRLSRLDMLRRADPADRELWIELLRSASARLECPTCGRMGLQVRQVDTSGQDEWERQCAGCGAVIPEERVELFPDVTHCARCQAALESGTDGVDDEYCPRCGSILSLKTTRSGVSRYVLHCTACRWQS